MSRNTQYKPTEEEVLRLIDETSMCRMAAVRHLQQKHKILAHIRDKEREKVDRAVDGWANRPSKY